MERYCSVRLQNSRFCKAGSAVSVILECEACEPLTILHRRFFTSSRPFIRIWSVACVRKKYSCCAVYGSVIHSLEGMHVCCWPSAKSRWLDIGRVLFLCVYKLRWSLGLSIHRKWTKLNITYPTISNQTSLVNKGFIIWKKAIFETYSW